MYGCVPDWATSSPIGGGVIGLHATDTASEWLVSPGRLTGIDPDDATVVDEACLGVLDASRAKADATPAGSAADLDCWLWRRPSVEPLERVGDHRSLDQLGRSSGQESPDTDRAVRGGLGRPSPSRPVVARFLVPRRGSASAAGRCSSAGGRPDAQESVFWRGGEVSFGGSVPARPRDRVLPPALHLLEVLTVGFVASHDQRLQLVVLRLDRFVGGCRPVRKVTVIPGPLAGPGLRGRSCLRLSREGLRRSRCVPGSVRAAPQPRGQVNQRPSSIRSRPAGLSASRQAWTRRGEMWTQRYGVADAGGRSRCAARSAQGGGRAGAHWSWVSPRTLPSGSVKVATKRPPPTSLGAWVTTAPAAVTSASLASMSGTCQ